MLSGTVIRHTYLTVNITVNRNYAITKVNNKNFIFNMKNAK